MYQSLFRAFAARALPVILFSLVPVLFPVSAFAQEPPETRDPIATDRPDFTESAIVVPRHSLQIENGFTYQNGRRVYTLSGPETLFRYGITDRFEARLGLPNYNRQRAGGKTTTGLGDLYFGAKIQAGPTRNGWDISVIPAVFLPTGHRDFSSGAVDPEIKLCFSKDLDARLVVSGMLYGSLPTENGKRNSTLQTTLSFGYDLGRRWSAFVEYAGTFSEHGGPEHLAHSGFAYLINNDTQFDIHHGYGLNRNAPESFLAAGLSFRFNTR